MPTETKVQAFRVLQDTSLPKALYEAGEAEDGTVLYESEGRSYDADSYVLASDISPPILQSALNGEMDNVLQACPLEEAEEWLRESSFPTVAPEHSVEQEALSRYGNKVLDRDQITELRAAEEQAKSDGSDVRAAAFAADKTNPFVEKAKSEEPKKKAPAKKKAEADE